jgi:esterase/lipase superfamily enzyme
VRCEAAPADAAPKYVAVPVYYLTDRNEDGETYGSNRKYFTDCKHDMNYGITYVSVPNFQHKTAADEDFKRLGWAAEESPTRRIARKDKITGDPASCKKQFFDLLGAKLTQSQHPDLCIFVHGADDAFEDASVDAAELSYFIRKPVVLYSWPSVPKMLKYFVDGDNSEWSQEHFNIFGKDLIAFSETHSLELTVVSHSMGNRLVVRSVSVLAGKHLVKDLEFVSPDIDEETFKHYVMGLQHARGRVRLYVSYKDKMLPLSQMLHGGYYRLGEGVGTVLGHALPPLNKVAPPKPGGSLVPESKVATVTGGIQKTADRIEIESIDFSAVDSGLRGHTIPFELIGNMLEFDQPGEGWTMVDMSVGSGSRLARMIAHHPSSGKSGTGSGHWLKVVRTDPHAKRLISR